MECRSALRLNALLFLFLISQCMYSTAFVSTAGKNYLQSRNRGMPQISFATSDFLEKPTMCASKSPLIQGMGSLSLGEAIASPMVVALHSGRFSAMQKAMCRIPDVLKNLWPNIKTILNPSDMLIFTLLYITYVPILKFLHTSTLGARSKLYTFPIKTAYEESIFGFIEKPIKMLLMFLPFVYALDIGNIVLHMLGFHFHIKGDMSRLLCVVYEAVTAGMFVTKIKDYALSLSRLKKKYLHDRSFSDAEKIPFFRIDKMREATVDELSSIVVWAFLFGLCLEAMSLEFGFALGSIFAVGGIGSASVVLALRSTMENIISGLLLKLQDKMRVGETVTIPGENKRSEEGIVEEVTYIATTIRREDNSVVVVPNQVFSKGEIINWSRTPFRLFKTSVQVKMSDCNILGLLINTIRTDVSELSGVETLERDLVVSASSFQKDMVTIDIEAHLKTSDVLKEGDLKTAVIAAIAKCLLKSQSKSTEDSNPRNVLA